MTSGNLECAAHAPHPMQDVGYDSERGTRQQRIIPVLILCLALFRGLLYVFIVPPWEHYDEPGHFEYAWMIAARLTFPQLGDYDRDVRREITSSMVEHRFGKNEYQLDLLTRDEPTWIGFSETNHPPLYYSLLALPLRLVRYTDVQVRLYVARLGSLVFYLLSVWIGYRLAGELVPSGHPLRWAVPGMMALLPAYTDLMTAVNNDVGAVAIFSLFLWGAVRTILRGVSPLRLSWVTVTAALCVWTKNTASVAVVLLPLTLALTWSRFAWARWLWASLLMTGLLLAVVTFAWGNAAIWYQFSTDPVPTSQRVADTPWGERAFVQRSIPGDQMTQFLPQEDVEALRGMTVTLGAWMWAAQPMQVRSPMLYDGLQYTWRAVEVNETPTFYAVETTISDDAEFVQIFLYPSLDQLGQEDITIYFDGVALAEGTWNGPPVFDDAWGRVGTWDGQRFVNRVRNSSAEGTWPRVRYWIDKPMIRYTRRSPTQFLASILDWERARSAYRRILDRLFQSFWARFGWNQIGLPSVWYWILGAVTVGGMLGAIVAGVQFWRLEHHLPRTWSLAFLAVAGILVWGNAILRSHPILAKLDIAVARLAYPAILPSILMLIGGWWTLTPERFRRWFVLGMFTSLSLLDLASLWTMLLYYHGR